MSSENLKASQQSVFELVAFHYSRDLRPSEILGLQKLVSEFGADRIEKIVLGFVEMISASLEGSDLTWSINKCFPKRSGIHNYVERKIRTDKESYDRHLI